MSKAIKLLSLVTLLLSSSTCDAALLMLRKQATRSGSIIRLGDIADISGASSAEVESLTTLPLLPAPAPGTQQFLTVAHVRDLLAAQGVPLGQLTIKGSLFVEIGDAPKQLEQKQEAANKAITKEEAELMVQQAIEQELANSSTIGRWRVEVSLTTSQLKQMQELGTDFSAYAYQKPRSGRIRFQLRGQDEGQLKVVANLTQIQSVIVTKRAITRGQLVRAVDVELRDREGNLPSGTISEMEDVIGKVALRSFKPDDLVQHDYLRAAWQVRKGETVDALVRAGSILVRTRAIAKENGAMGDLVMVETLNDKQRLDVTVSGPGEVTVYATGSRVADYATLNRRQTLLR